MQEKLRTAWLVVDFFTHRHRLSGRLNVRHKKLADQLNDTTSSFIELEDAYISNISQSADIIASYSSVILRKAKLTAVIVAQQEDGLRRDQSYGSYFGAYLRQVFITTSSLEITGHLRLSGKMDMRTVLTTGTDAFIPILDGEMRIALLRDAIFTGGMILVNKNQIGAFCIVEEKE
ncbi:MAG TPA: hypothetical protein ENN19_09025 [Chloroflexi bacterium]|nr:hypothetical protein [Chloroflexota bacterium]